MRNYTKLVNGIQVSMTEQEIADRQAEEAEWEESATTRFNNQQKKSREMAYKTESDPLFFKSQRGEVTLQEWQDKVEEIKLRFPYQE